MPAGFSRALQVLVVLGLLAAAFVGGRFSAPVVVETKEVEKVVYKDRVVEKKVEVAAAAKIVTKVVYRDRVVTPDGMVREHEEERSGSEEHMRRESTAVKVETREIEKLVTVEKRVELRPNWRVGALIGAQIREPLLPIAGPMVLGFEIDRRIVGGLSVGLWANTGGAAGASIAFEF